jgi:hypothetical protein
VSKGWIKIWREDIENNPYWPGKTKQPFTKMEAWLDLSILLAQGVDTETLKKGQAEVSVRFLSKRWQWSRGNVERWIRSAKERGYLKIESVGDYSGKLSVVTIFRPSKVGHVVGHLFGTPKPLNRKTLSEEAGHLFGTPSETPPRVNARKKAWRSKREANTVIGPKTAPDDDVSRILGHCLDKGPWKGFLVQNSEDAARARIEKRLQGGYSEEQLIHYVDVYLSKRRAHLWFKKRYGEDPRPTDRFWCPHIGWSIAVLFTRENYFPIWIDEGEKPVTKNELARYEDQEIRSLYQ